MPQRGWSRWDSAALGGLLAAFVGSRVLWIASNPRSSQYWEEGYRWLAVDEIRRGLALPLLDYQADHYQGGSLVLILVSVALSWLGVPSLAALKLVAVSISGATCAALFVIGRLFFGRAAGVLSASIYLLGPPLVAFWGVVAMGFHAESALFTLVGIGVCLRLADGKPRSPRAWLGLGVISGLGVWFAPTATIGVVACVMAWPFLAERPRFTELAAATAGLCLGLTPWFVYSATHEFAGFVRVLEVFGIERSADLWRSQGLVDRALDLLLRAPAQGLLDPGGDHEGTWWLRIAVVGVWLPTGLALAAAGRRIVATLRAGPRQAPPELRNEIVFPIYGALFVAAYLGSRFTLPAEPSPIGYRLMVPLAVLLMPSIAISAARGLRGAGGTARITGVACAVALLSLATTTVVFAWRHVEPDTPLALEKAGVTWGRIVQQKYNGDLARAVAEVRSLPPTRRGKALFGIGWGLQHSYEQLGRLADLSTALEPLAPADRIPVQGGIQFYGRLRRDQLQQRLKQSDDPDAQRALARVAELSAWLRHRPVVLITLGATRVDHLSCYGYERDTTPHLDAFAKRAVRFDRAWSTSSWTVPAHASLFTGTYPSRHGADYDSRGSAVLDNVGPRGRAGRLSDEFTTLAELLAEQGYRTGAFVAGPWLHRSSGLLQGFEHRDDSVRSLAGRPAHEITAAAQAWLEGVEPEQPYFLFANYFDPNAPYEPEGRLAEFPRAHDPLELDYDAVMRGNAVLEDDARAVLRDRYDAEIRDMDLEVGALLEAVLERPDGWRALIVVTADHGEALGEEGRLGHGFWLTEEQTRIPLLVRYSGDEFARNRLRAPIQLVDVMPLLARQLEIPLPKGVDGVEPGRRTAVFAELEREPTARSQFGSSYAAALRTVVRWPHKLEQSDDGRERLSLLSDDTLHEEPTQDSVATQALRAALEAHVRGGPRPVAGPPPRVAPETAGAPR